jgi:hypothetical protein
MIVPAARPPITPAATSPPPARTGVVAAQVSASVTAVGRSKNLVMFWSVARMFPKLTVALISNREVSGPRECSPPVPRGQLSRISIADEMRIEHTRRVMRE